MRPVSAAADPSDPSEIGPIRLVGAPSPRAPSRESTRGTWPPCIRSFVEYMHSFPWWAGQTRGLWTFFSCAGARVSSSSRRHVSRAMSSPWTPFHTSNYGTPDWHIPGDDAPERDGDSSSQSSRSSDSGSSGYSSAGHPRYTRRILRERIAWNEPLIDVGSEHVDVVSPRASPLSQAPSPGALSSRASRSHSVPRSRDEIFLHDEQPLWRSRASSMDARADVLGQAGADPAQASSSPMRQRSPSFPPRDATNDDQSLTALLTSHGKPGFRCQVVGCEKSGKVFSKRGLKDHRRWYHTNKFSVTTAAGDIFTVQRTASGQLHCPIEGCNRSFKHPTHLQGHAKACVLGDQLPVPARNAPNIPDKDRVLYVISNADKTKHTIGYGKSAFA